MLQALLLAAVFYAFIQISRDIASLLLYPESDRNNANLFLFTTGSAGNELYQAIKVDPKLKWLPL